ncbi:hypothetical protein CTZ27_18935 [Streptomyces griseocarneus]|nr:hypothetical protein CTZ27_18935 [Streptomyces griseocarneus]
MGQALAFESAEQVEQPHGEPISDQERALAQAREDARAEVLAEMSTQLVAAEIRAQAAAAGVSVDTDYLNLGVFTGEDGRPDGERIAAYVARQHPPEPKFPQLMGAGRYRGGRDRAPKISLDVRKR